MFNIRRRLSPDDKDMVFGRRDKQHPNKTKVASEVAVMNNDTEEGVIAFGMWLSHREGNTQRAAPMSMKSFEQGRIVVLHDRLLQKEVTVEIVEGVPSCKECRSKDCAHVGFAICAEQMHVRSRVV